MWQDELFGEGSRIFNRKEKKIVKILSKMYLFFLLIVFPLIPTQANAWHSTVRQKKQLKEIDFKTNFPSGLYLYKSKEEKNEFSPLFIVKDGRLHDPYITAEKIGEQNFYNGYVKGKKFSVVTNSTKIGKLFNLRLNFEKRIQTEEFVQDIEAIGEYSGNDLQIGKYKINSFYIEKDFYKFAVPKFIATPFSDQKKYIDEFSITKEDIEKAKNDAQKHLFPEAERIVSEILKREGRVIIGDKSNIDYAWAVDLEQNGKKVILGCYSIEFLYQYKKTDGDRVRYQKGGYPFEILFALREKGDIETISFDDGGSPAFSFINAIDLDGDGVKEILLEISRNPKDEPFFGGKSIMIFSPKKSNWKLIFQSAKIAKAINY